MDTLTLVLLIYFIVVHILWLTALICHIATKTDRLGTAMLFIAIVVTVPYIGVFVIIEQARNKITDKKTNEETDEKTKENRK